MSLDLLARCVSGAQVSVVGTTEDRAYVDGATIAIPTEHPDPRAPLAVQAALLALRSLTPDQIRGLRRATTAVVERYLVLEATRAANTAWLLPRRVAGRILALGAPTTTSASASLDMARDRGPLPAAPEWLGTIHPQLLRRNAAPEPEDDAAAEESRIFDLIGTPLDSPLTRMSRMLAGGTRVKGGGPGLHSGARSADRRAPAHVLQGQAAEFTRGGVPVPGVRYPEWDCHRAGYREAWCTVYDLDPAPDAELTPLPTAEDSVLRRQLARIGSAPQRRRNLRDGDSLDMCAVVEHLVQRRLGGSDDPRVFESRSWTARDLGVLVLLDATGSTAGADEGRRLFDEQRHVVHRLASVLSDLGDRTAVYAFNSRGREDVRFLRVKDFGGRYDEAARARLAAIRPADFTRLGAAVRHGTRLLSRGAGTSHQLLVVVGDGLPYDDGYEDRYAREDSRLALREALAAGVGCVSIGVGTSLESRVVDEVWGEVTHLHLAGPDELDHRVREAFGSALRLATARRREP